MAVTKVAPLKKRADAIFSKYIRYRDSTKRPDGYYATCITCGVEKPVKEIQNGHFVSRSCTKLRYDEQNCNAQCVSCNMFKGGEQYLYSKAIDMKYGDGTAEKLHSQRHISHKLTVTELEQIIKDATEQVKEYETS